MQSLKLYFVIAIIFVLGTGVTYGVNTYTVPFHATSTTQGWITPQLINGTIQSIWLPGTQGNNATSLLIEGENPTSGVPRITFTNGDGYKMSLEAGDGYLYMPTSDLIIGGSTSGGAANANASLFIKANTGATSPVLEVTNANGLTDYLNVQKTGRVGVGTTTPGTLLSIGNTGWNFVDNGTSTGQKGLNITAGCFAVNSVCVSGGGTPGGSNTYVQYNNSGSFGGVSSFAFDGVNTMSLGDGLNADTFTIQNNLNGAQSNPLTISTRNVTGGSGGINITTGNTTNSSVGDLKLTGGNGVNVAGGNILLMPGTGTSNGNVGVGTTSPYQTLSVAGTGIFTGALAAATSTNSSAFPVVDMIAWGDSLTGGTTGNLYSYTGYPSYLQQYSGYGVINLGDSGETSTSVRVRFLNNPQLWKYPAIIWVGRNNFNALSTIESDIDLMIAHLPNYVVMGIVNASSSAEWTGTTDYNTIIADNTDLASRYAGHYFDVRSYLITQADGTTADNWNVTKDVPPGSLRFDTLHFNALGNARIAKKLNSTYVSSLLSNVPGANVVTYNMLDSILRSPPIIGSKDPTYAYFRTLVAGATTTNTTATTTGVDAPVSTLYGEIPFIAKGNGPQPNEPTQKFFTDYAHAPASSITMTPAAQFLDSTGADSFDIFAPLAAMADTYLGALSGYNSTQTATLNASVGRASLFACQTCTQTVAVGASAGQLGTAQSGDTDVGYQSCLVSAVGSNTCLGAYSLYQTTSGNTNVGVGRLSGGTNVSGTSDIFIGANADASANNLSNAIAIGQGTIVGCSNCTSLAGQNTGIGTTSPYATLSVVGSTGVVAEKYTATSTIATSSFAGTFSVGSTSPSSSIVFSAGTSTITAFTQNKTTGNWGIGSTSPRAMFSIQAPTATATTTVLSIGSSTLNRQVFSVDSNGHMSVGFDQLGANNYVDDSDTSVLTLNYSSFNPSAQKNIFVTKNRAASQTFCIGDQGSISVFNSTCTYDANFNGAVFGGAVKITGGAAGFQVQDRSNNANGWQFYSSGGNFNMYDTTNSANAYTITSGTNQYGLGSSTPWGKMSIEMDTTNPAFAVSNQGSTTPSLVVGGVNQNGNVGVGTSSPWRAFSVSGTVAMANLSSAAGTISGGAYLCEDASFQVIYDTSTCLVSSKRFKNTITPLPSSLDEVLKLKPVSFFYNKTGNKELDKRGEQIGFIAEDVIKVEPRLATLDSTGKPFQVKYEQMTALLTKAIQDVWSSLQRLTARVSGLEKRLDEQQKEIDQLKVMVKALKK